ncbi:hypothetical protein GCM10011588_26270 [Nocardia jinanensis]|uniref:Uncharacterized protein n=1 Tax=Nocardia jinanensis TaxID=382504 RepID=A0A917RKF7_9NOCA|nr:hypothetical protein GCM10011588_26270 [Nocardia jinanensis]
MRTPGRRARRCPELTAPSSGNRALIPGRASSPTITCGPWTSPRPTERVGEHDWIVIGASDPADTTVILLHAQTIETVCYDTDA